MPRGADLWDLLAALAVTFHFQPSEIDALSFDEAMRWGKQVRRLHEPAARERRR
jgi:hypothetical protein